MVLMAEVVGGVAPGVGALGSVGSVTLGALQCQKVIGLKDWTKIVVGDASVKKKKIKLC